MVTRVDYYRVLGVVVTASQDEIKAAFHAAAKRCHPDLHPGDVVATARFQSVNEAYEILSDPLKRAVYDKPPAPDLVIKTKKHTYTVTGLHAEGELATLYRATREDKREVLLKIARAASVNDLLEREATRLGVLGDIQFATLAVAQFVPQLMETAIVEALIAGKKERRRVNVFPWCDGWHSLAQVRQALPLGLSGRHIGWIGNRLWALLAFLRLQNVVHGAILPEHVLIHPETHAILLVDWCYSATENGVERLTAVSASGRTSYPAEVLAKRPATSATDIYMAASVLLRASDLSLDYRLRRFLQSCLILNPARRPEATFELCDQWKGLLKDAFGEPQFVPLVLSEKAGV